MADHGHDDDYNVHAHISTIRTNTTVLMALLGLTGLTVLAYNVRLGDLNLTVAVLIAMVKATIVGAWFMHLKYEKKFNILFFAGSLIFVAIFLGYTMNDTAHRGRQGSITGLRVDPGTGNRAYGTDPLLRENGEFTAVPEDHDHEGHEGHEEGEAHDDAHEDDVDEHEHEMDEGEVEADPEAEADGAEPEADAEEAEEAVEVEPTMDPAPAAMTAMTAMTTMTAMTATMAPAAMAPAAMAPAAMAPAAMAPAAMTAMAPAAMAPAAMAPAAMDGE